MTSFAYSVLYLIYVFVVANCDCLENEFYLHHLGSNTPYRVVANLNDTELNYEGCKPEKIWFLVRHGTRNPSTKLIREMNTRLPEIQELLLNSELRDLDAKLFAKWKSKVLDDEEKSLAHEGEDEMVHLAERMQNRFPDVLPKIYSNTTYKFRFTKTQRTKESAKYFTTGLFGRVTAKDVWYPKPLYKDPILRFYKLCNKWTSEVKKNPEAVKERDQFILTPIVTEMLDDINKKLGQDNNLTFSDVYLMYRACAFETAWDARYKSPWCLPFSLANIKVMEFYVDLKHYWLDGYGHEITYRQACPAFNDMVEFFQSGEPHEKAVIYFTHSGTILKMLAHLGLYEEPEPLLHDSFVQKANRKWNVSKIDAFGSNLAFVLHDCGGIKKVLFLHQERVKQLPACISEDLCSLEDIIQYYNNSLSCSFYEMCGIKPAPTA